MRSMLITALLLLSNLCVLAQAPTSPTLRQSELSRHPFELGKLRLTVEKLSRKFGWFGPEIRVRLENPSDGAVTFDPQLLSFINKGSDQVNMLGYRGQTLPLLKVLPGAFVRERYLLSSSVRLPARLYYDGKELAVIDG